MNDGRRRARAERLADELRCIDTSEPKLLRERALSAIREASESDFSLFYNLAAVEGRLRVAEVASYGDIDPEHAMSVMMSTPDECHQTIDLSGLPKHAFSQFIPVRSAVPIAIEATPIYRYAWVPYGARDILSLVLTHGPELLGVAMAIRRSERRFDEGDSWAVEPLVGPVVSAFAAARCLARQGLSDEPAFIVTGPRGNIEHFSARAEPWIEIAGFTEALRLRIDEFDRGAEPAESTTLQEADARIVRIDGKSRRYLVSLKPAAAVRRSAETMLTAAQLAVARLAAEGFTIEQIAGQLERSKETVREHLDEAYRRLRVSSRAELLCALTGS